MAREWTKAEDLQPGISFKAEQPEHTVVGKVWTHRVVVTWPTPYWTWMTIRERDGVVSIDHGRVWPIEDEKEDGA